MGGADRSAGPVVKEAHALGVPVTAHAHGLPAVEQAVAADVDGIEHCSCLTPSGIQLLDGLLASLAARQIVVCLTLGWALGAAPSPAVAARMAAIGITPEVIRAAVGRMYRAGVLQVSGRTPGSGLSSRTASPGGSRGAGRGWRACGRSAGFRATSRAGRACGPKVIHAATVRPPLDGRASVDQEPQGAW
jgi:hypothetical protein